VTIVDESLSIGQVYLDSTLRQPVSGMRDLPGIDSNE
jgi:hypothetical protein